MSTDQDPVVTDITKYINRSAGQHARRIAEGSAHARALLALPVVDTMTDDRLHRIDASRLSHDDGVSVGGCCINTQALEDAAQMKAIRKWRESHQPVEFAGPEPYSMSELVFAILIVVAMLLGLLALSPELRGLLSLVTY